ncbi:MAG: hypothetical protein HY698_05340 [Deltaproteobacteria bacterium]|nr:hypothetical protein [Deltaproteobacteria bacterium]
MTIEPKKSGRSILDPVLKFLFDRHRGDFLRLLLGDRTSASVICLVSRSEHQGQRRAPARCPAWRDPAQVCPIRLPIVASSRRLLHHEHLKRP